MKGDIFNNCYGNATGDITNNSGASCQLESEYTPQEMTMLRSELQRAKTVLAVKKGIHKDYSQKADACMRAKGFRCKAKYGGSKNDLLDKRNAASTEVDIAQSALNIAQSTLDKAEKQLEQAKKEFTTCSALEAERKKEEELILAEKQKQADISAVELAKVDVEQAKVTVQKIETSKDYVKYGLIGVGVIALIFMGIKLSK